MKIFFTYCKLLCLSLCIFLISTEVQAQDQSTPVYGCTDVNASNYDPSETISSFCIYYGCTDSTSPNYDESANVDDDRLL